MRNGEHYIVKLVVAVLAALLSGGAGGWYLRPQLDPEKFVTRREFDREINGRLVGRADLLELLDRKLGPLEKAVGRVESAVAAQELRLSRVEEGR